MRRYDEITKDNNGCRLIELRTANDLTLVILRKYVAERKLLIGYYTFSMES